MKPPPLKPINPIDMTEVYRTAFAVIVAKIIIETFRDVVKKELDKCEWSELKDINTLLCVLEQIQCENKNEDVC